MFEKIFSFSAVLRRHREGPLASERLEYLKYLNDRGLALGTVLLVMHRPGDPAVASRSLLQCCRPEGHRRFLGSATRGTGTSRRSSLAPGAVPLC